VNPGSYFTRHIQCIPMSTFGPDPQYLRLVALVDEILEECEDEVPCIVKKLDALDADTISELIISDLLNSYQVFCFVFRAETDLYLRERLELEPASSLKRGLKIDETDLLEMYFLIRENKPVIVISDGDKVVATFAGKSAYGQGREFLKNPEYL
jgi:hypothetical protein